MVGVSRACAWHTGAIIQLIARRAMQFRDTGYPPTRRMQFRGEEPDLSTGKALVLYIVMSSYSVTGFWSVRKILLLQSLKQVF